MSWPRRLNARQAKPSRVSAGGVLLFHGNTMNFYVGALRFLPPALTRLGFACLAFNRRGHDIMSTRSSRASEGGAFQMTREAIEDNAIAARWMAERGFPEPVVMGHSNGGMLGVQHAVDHPATRALVLLSAGRGGPTSVQSGDAYRYPPEEFQRLASAPCEAVVVQECDHFYDGREEEVTSVVTSWLTRTLGLPPR